MKGKILATILFLMLFLNVIILSVGVTADLGSQTDYIEDFEDDVLTQQADDYYYGEKWFETIKTSGYSAYVHTIAQSGSKGYYMASAPDGSNSVDVNFNFTYPSVNIIEKFSIGMKSVKGSASNKFYMDCYDENDVKFLRWYQDGNSLKWTSYSGDTILRSVTDDQWFSFSIRILSNDSIEIFDGIDTETLPPLLVIDNPRISYIHLWSVSAVIAYKIYVDNIEIVIGDIEEEEEETGCEYTYMTDRYDYIGNINSGCNRQSNEKTVETRYNIPVDMNITGVDLAVASDQYKDDSDLSNYALTFNGVAMGSPVCMFEYSYYYILRWILNIELNNEIPILEFSHSEKTSYGRYWQVVTGCYSNTDLDNDGEINFKESSIADGVYNGQIWNWDLAYQMYYEDIQFPDDETYFDNDYIHVIDEIHYCGEPVWLTYTLTSMVSDTYLRIWNDDTGVEVNDGVYPYLCPTTSETMGFVAETSANYTASLNRSSVELDNVSFFVNDFKNPTNYVYTMPNPCFEGESYLVKYAFDNADNYDGAIFLSSTPDYRNYYEIHYILDGESGSYTQIQNAPCTLYYILAVDKNGTYYVTDNGIHQHTVKSRSLKNSFTLGANHLTLVDGEATQSINGETTHMGGNCKIYDNGKLIYTITETPFNELYTITTAGNHIVEMRLVTNETVILDTQTYTVSGVTIAEEIEDTSYIVHDWLYENYGDIGLFMGGICVVLGFMFIPFALVLYVNVSFNKNIALGDLHWSIYIIFAIVGVIVDVQLHLAELWIILLVCVVSIAIAVITWNGNR